jgi:subtilisin family serine protease
VAAGFAGPGEASANDANESKFVTPDNYRVLASTAATKGSVRIIVGAKAGFIPEPSFPFSMAHYTTISNAQQSVISELASNGLQSAAAYRYKYIPYLAMTVDKETLDALRSSRLVESIVEDIFLPPATGIDWNMQLIGVTDLRGSDVTGKGTAIAILDTGVDKSHPYLSGAVVSEACYSTNTSDGLISSLCPDGASESIADGSAIPYVINGCTPPNCDHGTHVAGIAAGRTGVNESPGGGVAPEASIIAIQVFSRLNHPSLCYPRVSPCVGASTADILKGLERVYELRGTNIASVNMSIGSGKYTTQASCDKQYKPFKDTIDSLRDAGIATIVASGNGDEKGKGYCGALTFPACISSAISVGATGNSDNVTSYSNTASFLSLLAPGGDTFTNYYITSSIPERGSALMAGTSMAAPHVAGAFAVMRQRFPFATTDLSVSDIQNILAATGTTAPGSGKCAKISKKRINIDKAYNDAAIVASIGGTKKGTVIGTDLDCSTDKYTCLGAYSQGTDVTIEAKPNKNSFLDSWDGCDSTSSGPSGSVCTVNVNSVSYITAIFNPPPKISPSSGTLNFGNLKMAGPFQKTVTFRNTGTSHLTIYKAAAQPDSEFKITENNCTASPIGKKESCGITIQISPGSFGVKTGQLIITSNATNKPNGLTVKLKANVVPPKITVHSALNFGSVAANTSLTKTISVKNTGLSDLVIRSVSLASERFFVIGSTNCNDGQTLAKGASCPVSIIFTPDAVKTTYTDSLTITSNVPNAPNGQTIVSLKGTGK